MGVFTPIRSVPSITCGADPDADSCLIPMDTLTKAPFNLGPGELIQIKSRARNLICWGKFSEKNVEGVKVFSTPTKMLTIKEGWKDRNTYDLSWDPIIGATSYKVSYERRSIDDKDKTASKEVTTTDNDIALDLK